MDYTATKIEPGTSVEESVAVTFTEIDIEYPCIKKECPAFDYENNSVSINVETVPIKAEPGPREEDRKGIPYTEIDLYLTDVKKGSFENSEIITEIAADTITDFNDQVHPGEKPHSCSHCNYSCSYKSDLRRHLRTHTGEKPYTCSHCNYSYSRKSNLTRHSRTHTLNKPLTCSHCNYSCSRKSDLTLHLRNHT